MRILIVDDNADLALVLASSLANEGYAVEVAANGRDAIVKQRASPAEVVLLDLFMPDMDGFETLEAIRKEFADTRILMMSGSAKEHYLRAANLVGADATLQKPFETAALLAKLRSIQQGLSAR